MATNLRGISCPTEMKKGATLAPNSQESFQEKMPSKTHCPNRANYPYCQTKSKLLHIKSFGNGLHDNGLYVKQELNRLFDSGLAIDNTNLKLFMAKAFPVKYISPGSNVNDYKFIFLLTNNNLY